MLTFISVNLEYFYEHYALLGTEEMMERYSL